MSRKRITLAFALAAGLVGSVVPASRAQDCNQNGIPDVDELFEPVHYQRVGGAFGLLPFAVSDVLVTVHLHEASLADANSFVSLKINGTTIGSVFANAGPLPCGDYVDTLTIDPNTWLSAVGPTGVVTATCVVSGISLCSGGQPAYDYDYPLIELDYAIDADCDGDGVLNVCEVNDCASSGVNNSCYPDSDGDGVIDLCDMCVGADGSIDTDGDGVPDTCDECANQNDNEDCNFNGIKDCLELTSAVTFDQTWGTTDQVPCAGTSIILPDLPLPASIGDVTFTLNWPLQGFVNPGDALELYGNNVLLGVLYNNLPDCTASDTLIIPEATWNSATQADNGSVDLELRGPVGNCGSYCGTIPDTATSQISYTANYDTNGNGVLDFCPCDSAYNGPDSDGDHVSDDCDQCPNTIPGHPYVDETGCPYVVAKADFDSDGDVDESDFGGFFSCDTGPDVAVGAGCEPFDYSADGHVDLIDFLNLQDAASGPDVFAEIEAMGYKPPNYILVDGYTGFGGNLMSWEGANAYCKKHFGTRLATIDPTLSTAEQNACIDEMAALAAAAGGYDVWMGLKWYPNSVDRRFYWADGQPFIPTTEVGGFSVPHWLNGMPTPNPDDVLGGSTAFCVALIAANNYEWLNVDCVDWTSELVDVRACLCDRPDYYVGSEDSLIPAALNVQLTSGGSNSVSVLPGRSVDFDVRGVLDNSINQGLAGFAFDLSFDGGALTAMNAPAEMQAFSVPNGYNNPGGFGGTMVNGDLIQVGGGQNTVNNTDPNGPTGTVTTGIGHAEAILATGALTAPLTPGTYTLTLTNLSGTTINLNEMAPVWKCEPANAGTITNLTVIVEQCEQEVAVYDPGTPVKSSVSDGNIVAINRASNGFELLATPNPTFGAPLATVSGSINTIDGVNPLALDNNRLFVAGGAPRIYDVADPNNPTLLATISGHFAWDVAVQGSLLAAALEDGLALYDITDPANPALLSNTPTQSYDTGSVTFHDGLLYWNAQDSFIGALAILDITNPAAPVQLGSIPSFGFPSEPEFKDGVALISSAAGLRAIDVTNPNNPTEIASVATSSATVSAIALEGGLLYRADYDTGLQVFDVTDVTAPVEVSQLPAYASSYGLTNVNGQLYVSSLSGGLAVLDVNDADNDGVPAGCDVCNGDDATGDSDGDGVCDNLDLCPGFDDMLDSDGDGVPDGCDLCPGFDDTQDADGDGIPDGCDNCPALPNPDQIDSDAPNANFSPLAVWHFNENGGTTATDVVAGYVSTLNGVVWNSVGRQGAALEFPVGGSNVTVPAAADLGVTDQLTISLWVNPSAFPVNYNRFVTRLDGNYVFRLDGRKPHFYVKKGGVLTGARANVLIDADKWTHLAAVWDGLGDGVLRLYIDGVEASSYDFQGTASAPLDSSTAGLNLGNPSGERFEGLMDELGIFNRAFSAGEIQSLMTDGLGDGVGDVCDVCRGDDASGDSDGDGVCDNLDVCPGYDDNIDSDGDGIPDGCDQNFAVGDLNCDGTVDLFDIDPFVLALTSATHTPAFDDYIAAYPSCDPLLADIDNNGTVDLFDIDPFVALLTTP